MEINLILSGLETYRKTLEIAEAGDQVGCLLRGLKREELRRGHVMVSQNLNVKARDKFESEVSSMYQIVWITVLIEKLC